MTRQSPQPTNLNDPPGHQCMGPAASDAGPSSVHPQETTLQLDAEGSYRGFLISGIRDRYLKVLAAFRAWDRLSGKSRTAAILRCRVSAWFVRHVRTFEVRVHSARCHVRWCPLCETADRYCVASRILAKIRTLNRTRFITLTMKHSTAPLRGQIDHLYHSFIRLRRSRYMKSKIRGGVWFFQVKWIEASKSWHPHLHILYDGHYIPHEELKNRWRRASRGSYVVDIRSVRANSQAADYVARYAVGPCDLAGLEAAGAVEVMAAMAGRQIKGTWGTFRDICFKATPAPDADDWQRLCPFQRVSWFRDRSQFLSDIWSAWIGRKPCHVHPSLVNDNIPPPVWESKEEPEVWRQLWLFRP